MNYTGSVPDTATRTTDWLSTAPCKAEPEAMFPGTLTHEIEHAKAYCRRCPAVERCLQWALDTGTEHGVWGGLTEDERRTLTRRAARKAHHQPVPTDVVLQRKASSLKEAFTRRTSRTDDGHLLWQGMHKLKYGGNQYTMLQAAFLIGYGRQAKGLVQRTCEQKGCCLPQHLADDTIRAARAVCGTRAGYLRHRKAGQTACQACRRANTDADNRLRRTGTTKVLA